MATRTNRRRLLLGLLSSLGLLWLRPQAKVPEGIWIGHLYEVDQ